VRRPSRDEVRAGRAPRPAAAAAAQAEALSALGNLGYAPGEAARRGRGRGEAPEAETPR
jgi:Holliday junction DNA helicase RuvA